MKFLLGWPVFKCHVSFLELISSLFSSMAYPPWCRWYITTPGSLTINPWVQFPHVNLQPFGTMETTKMHQQKQNSIIPQGYLRPNEVQRNIYIVSHLVPHINTSNHLTKKTINNGGGLRLTTESPTWAPRSFAFLPQLPEGKTWTNRFAGSWLNQPIWKICASQMGDFLPQFSGWK